MSSTDNPALVFVAPVYTDIPKSLDSVIDLMDDPVAPWACLGMIERGSVVQGYEPFRITADFVSHDQERFRIVGVPSRLAIVDRDPDTCAPRGQVWPVATLHPVNPAHVRDGKPLRTVWDVSDPNQVVSYGDAERA